MVNITVPIVITALYLVFWAFALRDVVDRLGYLIRRCVLSIAAVSYLSYIAVTKTALNVLYCVDVESSTELDVSTTTKYWAADTSLECYHGSHFVLLGTVGWPVLVLFSFAFPVGVACILILQRRRGELRSASLHESFGFMFRAYNEKVVFWESVIMARKALLAVAVTFAYPLGGNLQGVLCVCVLMFAHYIHTLFSPFRPEFDELNKYEGLSLLMSAFTLASGLFFNDDHASASVRVLLTVVVFCGNVLCLLFFFAAFCRAIADCLRVILASDRKFQECDNWSTPRVLAVFLRCRLNEFSRTCYRRFKKGKSENTQPSGQQLESSSLSA